MKQTVLVQWPYSIPGELRCLKRRLLAQRNLTTAIPRAITPLECQGRMGDVRKDYIFGGSAVCLAVLHSRGGRLQFIRLRHSHTSKILCQLSSDIN